MSFSPEAAASSAEEMLHSAKEQPALSGPPVLSHEQRALREQISRGVKRGGIDLHLHSSASDGTLPPREFPAFAAARDLSLFALSDHDSISGCAEVLQGIQERLDRGLSSPAFIPAVELSLRESGQEVHLLGYFPDLESQKKLLPFLQKRQASRERRNLVLIKKLNAAGYPVKEEELRALSHGQMGRVHAGLWLIEKGYAHDLRDAFGRILGEKGSCYVPRDPCPLTCGIRAILSAGGLPYLAHPFQWRAWEDKAAFPIKLKKLKEAGLVGMEVFHSEASPDTARQLLALARRFGLAISAGSDWHGENKKTRPAYSGATRFDLS